MRQTGWLIGGGVLGFALSLWSVRRGRRAYPADTAVLHWEETVVSAWRQDPIAALFIGVHAATVVALAVLAGFNAARAPLEPVPWISAPAQLLAGFMAGAVLGFPLASRIGPPMPMALYPEGVVRGRFVADWSAFSHFAADPSSGLIRLYSPRIPTIARVAWRPPGEELFREVIAFLVRHLPGAAPGPAPWYRTRLMFDALGVAITLLPLIKAIALTRSGWPWTAPVLAGTAYLVCVAGFLLIRIYRLD
jgi:hypothetical protein